ncbi:hypothetical protein INS49_010850 [Diaporthe citri]|uniref:uncharacterized protein n=1 Tax=Diaporthe citri TaxID=83186 RepID=UPI001C8243B0|nr:uncharacterized protein INS49_010850 [Diaporthe citri]KAG6359798.1 hypothetical protein INS49_010850 [Diaporthe citri]
MRPAAAAVNRLRKPRFGDVSAACYTTVRGSSAVPDPRYKDARRTTLRTTLRGNTGSSRDGLALLRRLSSLSASEQDAEERAPSTGQRPSASMRPRPLGRDSIEILSSICKTDDALIRHAESRPTFEEFIRNMHKTYDPAKRLGDPAFKSMGPNFEMIAESIKEESQPGGILHREPLTNQQFERYHGMMNKLVDSLIIQSYYDETPSDPEYARKSLQSLDSAWTAIRLLRSEGYPRYNHPGLDPAAAEEGRTKLTDMLRKLFDSWDEFTRSKYQVAKICYNLLVCPVPPSIHHYNALILGFTRKRMHNLSDLVVESLLDESRLRPTPQTVACLLLHYRQKDDILGFYGVIRRMLAIDNRGLLIRRRWYEEAIQIPDLRKWAKGPEVRTSLKGNWVIEMPMRNRDIYETLVSGLLHFGRVKDAAKVFVASLKEKWGISVELFIQLLRQCLYTLDAPAADILLRGFVENARVMNALVLRANCPRKLAEHLYPLLNMGQPPSWPFSEERARLLWHSKTLATTAEDRTSIRRLTVAMFIRQAENHLLRLDKIIRRLVRIKHTSLGPRDVIDCAQMGMRELLSVSLHNRELGATLLKHQALLKIATELEERTWDVLPGTTAQLYRRVVLALEFAIPGPTMPGIWERFKHDEQITLLATQWMRYRLSKMHGLRREVQRTTLDIELRLMMARRLQGATRRILFSYGVRSLKSPVDNFTRWELVPPLDDEINIEEATTDAQPEEADLEDELPAWAPGPVVSTA